MQRTVAIGMHGEDVRAVQQGLNLALGTLLSPPLVDDGKFGNATDSAVRLFQRRTGLEPDGRVGSKTRNKLFSLRPVTGRLLGMRLKMPDLPGSRGIKPPNLGPGPLHFPGTPGSEQPTLKPNLLANYVQIPTWGPPTISYQDQKFPGLKLPVRVPPIQLPDPPQLPPLPPLPPPVPHILPQPQPGAAWTVHHFELSPGASATITKPAQFAFSLAFQGVVMAGNDDGAHQEVASGISIGTPPLPDGGDWTIAYYVQFTDVDRFGSIGNFHWYQPYAQIGVQHAPGGFSPQFTGALVPLNLTLDVTKTVGVNVAGGMMFVYDPATGTVTVGRQMAAGLIFKLGQ